MPEPVVDDPLLRLIEWHASAQGGRGHGASDRRALGEEDVIDSVLLEWHIQESRHHDTRGRASG